MLEGIIIFKLLNAESKSEAIRPFIYLGRGRFTEVWMRDDYSISGDMLIPYDGKTVAIEGEKDEDYGIFVIEKISEKISETNRTSEENEDNAMTPQVDPIQENPDQNQNLAANESLQTN